MPKRREKKWQILYAFEGEIYSYIKNAIGDGDIARDLCQDVYLTVLQKLDELDENRSLKNWLFTVTRNRVINYFHFRNRREHEEIREDILADKIRENSANDHISEIINLLPERQRQVLLMREMEGWAYSELAERLDLTVSAVTSLLKRARDNFQIQYLLHFLPRWFGKAAREIELNDLLRFINPFDPPENLPQIIEQQTSAYFNRVRQDWKIIQKKFINENDIGQILNYLPKSGNLKIADCGSGGGAVSISLALSGHTVYSCDRNPAMLQLIQQQRLKLSLNKVHLVQTDLQNLPFSGAPFDALFFVLVLHHVADPLNAVQNNLRLLRSRGRLIIVDFLRHRDRAIADEMRDLWLGFQPSMFSAMLKNNGFSKIEEWRLSEEKRLPSFVQIWEKS